MAGKRKTGLQIPWKWEKEFQEKNPLSLRLKEEKRLFSLLAHGLAKAEEKKHAAKVEGQGGSTERRSG